MGKHPEHTRLGLDGCIVNQTIDVNVEVIVAGNRQCQRVGTKVVAKGFRTVTVGIPARKYVYGNAHRKVADGIRSRGTDIGFAQGTGCFVIRTVHGRDDYHSGTAVG